MEFMPNGSDVTITSVSLAGPAFRGSFDLCDSG